MSLHKNLGLNEDLEAQVLQALQFIKHNNLEITLKEKTLNAVAEQLADAEVYPKFADALIKNQDDNTFVSAQRRLDSQSQAKTISLAKWSPKQNTNTENEPNCDKYSFLYTTSENEREKLRNNYDLVGTSGIRYLESPILYILTIYNNRFTKDQDQNDLTQASAVDFNFDNQNNIKGARYATASIVGKKYIDPYTASQHKAVHWRDSNHKLESEKIFTKDEIKEFLKTLTSPKSI